ncbi:Methionyl-tRNA formyltransferase [hydrothermal vent metagenome]|uniref:methionyl-tRNA formyltransferase n=1 Tax=hydrothermal vent metagenome TaxID=652676 RepID=A0A3B1A4K3_9ZZZZ
MKIIFAGTPDFAAVALAALIKLGHTICAVYCQPDRPAGRGRKLKKGPVKLLAEEHGLAVYQPPSLKKPEIVAQLQQHDADIMVVVAYGLILPANVLSIPKKGCINIHGSLLPRWRGAAPIHRAIMAGDAETGITIIQMDEGLDTGDMLLRYPCAINDDETGQSLHDKLAHLGGEAILAALHLIGTGEQQPVKQKDALTCYAAKIAKKEAWLDWSLSAEELARKIRAFNPWPVARCNLTNQTFLIWDAERLESLQQATPGELIAATDQGLDIATGDGVLRITQVQLPGKRPVIVADLLRSRVIEVGSVFTGPTE